MCFLQQQASNTELLILSDGTDVKDLVPDDDRIRLIHLEGHPGIGDKRNFGCERSAGNSSRTGMTTTTRRRAGWPTSSRDWKRSGKSVTGYHSIRFTDGERWWKYGARPTIRVGTSLVYRARMVEAESLPFGADRRGQPVRRRGQRGGRTGDGGRRGPDARNDSSGQYQPAKDGLGRGKRSSKLMNLSTHDPEQDGCESRRVRPGGPRGRRDLQVIVVDDFDGPTRFLLPCDEPVDWRMGKKPLVVLRNINIGIRAAGAATWCCSTTMPAQDAARVHRHAAMAAAIPSMASIAATCNNVATGGSGRRKGGVRDEPRMVCFVCVFIPRSTLETVGLLDERSSGTAATTTTIAFGSKGRVENRNLRWLFRRSTRLSRAHFVDRAFRQGTTSPT